MYFSFMLNCSAVLISGQTNWEKNVTWHTVRWTDMPGLQPHSNACGWMFCTQCFIWKGFRITHMVDSSLIASHDQTSKHKEKAWLLKHTSNTHSQAHILPQYHCWNAPSHNTITVTSPPDAQTSCISGALYCCTQQRFSHRQGSIRCFDAHLKILRHIVLSV